MGNTCGSAEENLSQELGDQDVDFEELKRRFEMAGQGHVFNGADNLDDDEKAKLVKHCTSFNVNKINDLYQSLVQKPQQQNHEEEKSGFDTVEQDLITSKVEMSEIESSSYNLVGKQLIKDGHVGVVVLAGGQGSRLGFNGPKGKFDIGLPSKKSLFQILVERFFKAQMDSHDLSAHSETLGDGTLVPVIPPQALTSTMFVMTSSENHDETVQFFKENAYFGGQESSFVFFQQSMLPAVDISGKILMKSHCELQLAPNGNGALFEALSQNRQVQQEISRFQYLQIIGVDNALNKVLDPIQIGFTHKNSLQTSLKSCTKRDAAEKVGVIGKKNGHYDIIEYSEMPPTLKGEISADGNLKFKHGHILVFLCRTDLILNLCTKSKAQTQSLYHKAFKKINHVDPDTFEDIKPTEENGWKFELFIHNFLPYVDLGKLGVLMVERETEFAPVKDANPEGHARGDLDSIPRPDTPADARRLILAEAAKWLQSAEADGLKIDPATRGNIEVSFLLSYAGENLGWLRRVHRKNALTGQSGYLDHEGDYREVDLDQAD